MVSPETVWCVVVAGAYTGFLLSLELASLLEMQERPRAHVREGHRKRVDACLRGVIVVSLCCQL